MSQGRRLALVLAINLAMVAGLLTVGLLAHSLGVFASGADYLGDALGAGLSLTALRLSRGERGSSRATSLAALANSSFLLIVTAAVAVEAIRRLIDGAPSIHSVSVIVVSVIAACAMVACACILGDVDGDLSMESVMLDTLADAAAAIGVAISATIILATGGAYWLDSLVALLIAIVVAADIPQISVSSSTLAGASVGLGGGCDPRRSRVIRLQIPENRVARRERER